MGLLWPVQIGNNGKDDRQIFSDSSQLMDAQTEFEHDPRIVCKTIFDGAKRYWGSGLALKIGATALGVWSVLAGASSPLAPAWVTGLAIVAELCLWRSDLLKGRGESLKRKIEYQDSFGWALSAIEISDHLARLPASTRRAIARSVRENYFASKEAVGTRRALENLQESSWWSKDLAGYMGGLCSALHAVLMLASFASLYVSVATVRDFAALQTVSRVVTGVLSMIGSLGLVKLIVGYYGFSRGAERIERATVGPLQAKRSDQVEAIKLLHEYQVARAG